jgi:hypothetical protein
MKAQAETWGPIKLKMKSGKPATGTEAPLRSYHDRVMEEISKSGQPPKPLT